MELAGPLGHSPRKILSRGSENRICTKTVTIIGTNYLNEFANLEESKLKKHFQKPESQRGTADTKSSFKFDKGQRLPRAPKDYNPSITINHPQMHAGQ